MHASRCCIFGITMMVWAISAQADPLEDFGVQQPHTHQTAPAFSLPQLGGGNHALADERGHIVLIHFWATWCIPCRHEMPQIEQLWQKYRSQGLLVLGINVNRGNPSDVQAFVHERTLSFPVVLDMDGTVRNQYEVRALPSSYLIDRKGKIIGRIIGERNWLSPDADAMLNRIIKNEEIRP